MDKNKQMTPRKRAAISQYIKDGLSVSEISHRLRIPSMSVSNIVRRLRQTGLVDAGRLTCHPRLLQAVTIPPLNVRQ